ncbi:glycosyltransferase [Porphyrobacter algicida]|uniref:Glycosyltransferase n=1 Tax=Qipengyuania algicida TaxID=1836209 RepID=A0A845AG66_9SPHN|nr:glycosyltransferase family A protein [Qipengyuania algicida]MXP27961.1 glycosyltransferase [Qipengyuania algicida]
MGHLRSVSSLVTAVIPSFNHRDYITRSIESVLAQDYSPVQLVVIDDGSTDGSADLLRNLAKGGSFELFEQENQGVCRTLNRAIREHARGDWIALLGSDDLWRPDKLRLQMAEIAKNPHSHFCFSQARTFSDEAQLDGGRIFPHHVRRGSVLNQVFLRQHVPAGTMLFSRDLYDELGGFDESLREEDWDFVIRSAAATKFCAIAEPLLYYRSHATNTMKTSKRSRIFQQKMQILSKNRNLVSPLRRLTAIALHFVHDFVWSRLVRS